jgi:hypothetical protein
MCEGYLVLLAGASAESVAVVMSYANRWRLPYNQPFGISAMRGFNDIAIAVFFAERIN